MRSAKINRHLWLRRSEVNERALRSALVREGARPEEDVPLYLLDADYIGVPRAFAGLLRNRPEDMVFEDLRPSSYRRTRITSNIQLDHARSPKGELVATGGTLQREALAALMQGHDGGLELYCGAGKTVVAAHFLALKNVPTLVVVDNEPLLEQWQEECRSLLSYNRDVEGLWQGSKNQWQRDLVFTTYQTLSRRAEGLTEEQRRHFGLVIYDEGHHLGAAAYHLTASAFYGQRINLSATPTRADGLHVLTEWHIGPSLYRNLKPPLPIHTRFLWTGTKVAPPLRGAEDTHVVDQQLAKLAAQSSCSLERTNKVLELLRGRRQAGRRQLFLTRSLTAIANIASLWLGRGLPFPTPESAEGEGEARRTRVLRELCVADSDTGIMAGEIERWRLREQGSRSMVFSILKYGREGFNQPALDTVVLDGPVADEGLLQQVMGRPTRLYPGKPLPEMLVIVDDWPLHRKMAKNMVTMMGKYPAEKGGPLTLAKEAL